MDDFIVDTHFHIWDLKKFDYAWPNSDVPELNRNFTVAEYGENIQHTAVQYGIFIQVLNSCPAEAKWVLEKAQSHLFLKGVVAGLDLTNPEELNATLESFKQYPEFLGCRHILDFETAEWISKEEVKKGIEIVGQHGYTFDLLLRPHLLKLIPPLVSSLPSQKFVIDHIAKPFIKDGKLEPWKTEMAEIAKYPNVFCKISGLVTEADLKAWKVADFKPYIQHVLEIFGPDRCMFGSDWPVCTLAGASLSDVLTLAKSLTSHLSEPEKRMIFQANALKFYSLKVPS